MALLNAKGVPSFHTTRWNDRHQRRRKVGAKRTGRLFLLCPVLIGLCSAFLLAAQDCLDDAQDLTQSFFLYLCRTPGPGSGVDRLKNKFRSFLLASFENHLSDAADRARRLKRGRRQGIY